MERALQRKKRPVLLRRHERAASRVPAHQWLGSPGWCQTSQESTCQGSERALDVGDYSFTVTGAETYSASGSTARNYDGCEIILGDSATGKGELVINQNVYLLDVGTYHIRPYGPTSDLQASDIFSFYQRQDASGLYHAFFGETGTVTITGPQRRRSPGPSPTAGGAGQAERPRNSWHKPASSRSPERQARHW
jgi:hypothetical protein